MLAVMNREDQRKRLLVGGRGYSEKALTPPPVFGKQLDRTEVTLWVKNIGRQCCQCSGNIGAVIDLPIYSNTSRQMKTLLQSSHTI